MTRQRMAITVRQDDSLTATEVVRLRKECGWDHDVIEWGECLGHNLIDVSARLDDGTVIGVGFLIGNARHAQIVDLVVHPDYRRRGIGREIFENIVKFAKEQKIKYFGLTYDKSHSWLKSFYESEGFVSIDFAMWHKDSLNE